MSESEILNFYKNHLPQHFIDPDTSDLNTL